MTLVPRRLPVHPIPSLIGGLNDQMSPDDIQDFEMADCENFSIEEGAVVTAPGYVMWDDNVPSGSPADYTNYGPYWGGVMFRKADGTMVDIRQRQGVLEYSPDGIETWSTCTLPTSGSPAATITLTQAPCTFATLNDIVIWTNGYDTVMSSTDGITWTLQTGLPISKVVFNNGKNRVLYLGQTGTNRQFRFDWSNINDPLTIGANSYQLVDPNSNGFVIGAGKTPDGTNLIFKEGALYSVADFVDDGIIDINYIGEVKLASHQTIATTNDSVIFATIDGIYEYIGGTIRKIDGKINKSKTRNIVPQTTLWCGVYFSGIYYLSKPDNDISQNYNSQEYLIYKNIRRDDPIQPYAITRNRRFFGCYFIEDSTFDYGRAETLFVGDSRSDGHVFGFVNTERLSIYEQGLAGEAQSAYFVTKFFTEGTAYYAKRFKKFFTNLKVDQDLSVTIGYRFQPYGVWNETTVNFTTGSIDFDEGFGFSEGFGFATETAGQSFLDIENIDKPRGIQFKISTNQINDVRFLDFAYNYVIKGKFK